MAELCAQPGMPSETEVKKWLLNKDYAHEYEGFRHSYTNVLGNMSGFHCKKMEELRARLCKAIEENSPDAKQLQKEFRDYYTAAHWQYESCHILSEHTFAQKRGDDILIEGEHFCALPVELPPLPPLTDIEVEKRNKRREELKALWEERKKEFHNPYELKEGESMRKFFDSKYYSKTLLRSDAEKIIGTLLFYGRHYIKKRARRRAGERFQGKRISMVRRNTIRVKGEFALLVERIHRERREKNQNQTEKVLLLANSFSKSTFPANAGIPPAQRNLSEQIIRHVQASGDRGQGAGDNNSPQANSASSINNSAFYLNRFQKREIGKASPRPGAKGSNYTPPKKKRKRK